MREGTAARAGSILILSLAAGQNQWMGITDACVQPRTRFGTVGFESADVPPVILRRVVIAHAQRQPRVEG